MRSLDFLTFITDQKAKTFEAPNIEGNFPAGLPSKEKKRTGAKKEAEDMPVLMKYFNVC